MTGRERRPWYPTGSCEEARTVANQLAAARTSDRTGRSSLTGEVYLAQRWLQSKRVSLRASTWDGYRRNIDLHGAAHRPHPAAPFPPRVANVTTRGSSYSCRGDKMMTRDPGKRSAGDTPSNAGGWAATVLHADLVVQMESRVDEPAKRARTRGDEGLAAGTTMSP